jgi:hypothetical protein
MRNDKKAEDAQRQRCSAQRPVYLDKPLAKEDRIAMYIWIAGWPWKGIGARRIVFLNLSASGAEQR